MASDRLTYIPGSSVLLPGHEKIRLFHGKGVPGVLYLSVELPFKQHGNHGVLLLGFGRGHTLERDGVKNSNDLSVAYA
jgi:hypothetical protein